MSKYLRIIKLKLIVLLNDLKYLIYSFKIYITCSIQSLFTWIDRFIQFITGQTCLIRPPGFPHTKNYRYRPLSFTRRSIKLFDSNILYECSTAFTIWINVIIAAVLEINRYLTRNIPPAGCIEYIPPIQRGPYMF